VNPRLGRAVTVGDIAEVHRKAHPRCICHGTAMLVVLQDGRRVEKQCSSAGQDFKRICADRFVLADGGGRWLAGYTPEELAFTIMFHTSMLRFAEEQALRRHYRIERDRWTLHPVPQAFGPGGSA
jgi:hypothetical protein